MPPRTNRPVPAIILTAGVIAATAILLNAAHDTAPPAQPSIDTGFGVVARTPDDAANPNPTAP